MARQLASLFIVLSVLFSTVGCGTLDVDLHLEFHDDGASAELTTTGTGVLGASVLTSQLKDDFAAKGWQTSLDRQGEIVTLRASADTLDAGRRASLAASTPSPSSAESKFLDGLSYERRDNVLTTDYVVRFKVPVIDSPPPMGDELIDEKTMLQIVNSMLRFKVSMTLPGEIIETNADSRTVDTATWLLSYESLVQGRDLYVMSRQTNYGNIAGIAILLLLIGAGGVWLAVRRSAS